MNEFFANLPAHLQARFHANECDISDSYSGCKAFNGIEEDLGGIDVLVIIAGTHSLGEREQLLQANEKSMRHCIGRAFSSMQARKFSGDILIVDNLYGRKSQNTSGFSTFGICKLVRVAMNVLDMQMEYSYLRGGVRITNIFPNPLCLMVVGKSNDTVLKLEPEDISSSALHVLSLPPNLEELPRPIQLLRGDAICQICSYPNSVVLVGLSPPIC